MSKLKLRFLSSLAAVAALLIVSSVAVGAFGDPPAVGAAAPEFTLTTNEGKQASLKDFRGNWVVLYFYPKDFTSGCTLEAHNFQQDLSKYEQAHAVILGVSVDTAESHKSFCAKEGLNFKLLADEGGKVSDTYGSVMEYQGNKYSARNTFIINPEGKIARVFTKVGPAGHSAEVLAALAELQKQ
ncbi:MAG: peroxiredoxin [Pyrinomonadaceae bacterium]